MSKQRPLTIDEVAEIKSLDRISIYDFSESDEARWAFLQSVCDHPNCEVDPLTNDDFPDGEAPEAIVCLVCGDRTSAE